MLPTFIGQFEAIAIRLELPPLPPTFYTTFHSPTRKLPYTAFKSRDEALTSAMDLALSVDNSAARCLEVHRKWNFYYKVAKDHAKDKHPDRMVFLSQIANKFNSSAMYDDEDDEDDEDEEDEKDEKHVKVEEDEEDEGVDRRDHYNQDPGDGSNHDHIHHHMPYSDYHNLDEINAYPTDEDHEHDDDDDSCSRRRRRKQQRSEDTRWTPHTPKVRLKSSVSHRLV